MLIDDRNVVALPEGVKLSSEREQDPSGTGLLDSAALSGGSSGSAPALASSAMASGLAGGRNQHRCDRRACANAAGCDQRDGDQGTHPTAVVTTVQGAKRCPRRPAIGLFTSTGGKAMAKYGSWVKSWA